MILKGQVSAMITENQVKNYLRSKDKDYVNKLIESLYEQDDEDIDPSHKACPICGSVHFKKNGKDKNRHQRYICLDCHKSFSDRTNTLFYWSHFTLDQWLHFIELELYKMPLEGEAQVLETSKTTCFYMRHKLYHAASEIMGHQKLSGEVEIDTLYKSINLKGTRPQNMPRYSKKRGKQAAYRGVSHHKVAIVCATDENDHMMMQVSGLGSESFDKYKANKDYFKDVEEFISDSKASIQQFANYLEAVNNKIKTSPLEKRYLTDDGKSLGAVNEMMTEVSSMIQTTRGIGTRYIQGYLDFLLLKKQAKYTFKRKEMASEILRMMMDTEAFNNEMVRATPMPISLKEAYYEYRYGIFAE